MSVKAVLLDIEGTTTPISFVVDELFPYVRRELHKYLNTHWDDPQVQKDVEGLRQQSIIDKNDNLTFTMVLSSENSKEDIINSVVKNVQEQMDVDRKIGALKQLQGHMWKSGYQSGELCGAVYDDVPIALQNWADNGIPVYIYSSGSVEAQKLLFGNSTAGNLLPLIKGHFDTSVGLKVETASYEKISAEINIPSENILFITDSGKELRAAIQSHMQLRFSVRPGNPHDDTATELNIKTIHSFNEI